MDTASKIRMCHGRPVFQPPLARLMTAPATAWLVHRPSASSQPPRMFGGIAFVYLGNMAVGVTGDELMVRVGPDAADAALARPRARDFDTTGRPMRGWVVVAGSAGTQDEALGTWIDE